MFKKNTAVTGFTFGLVDVSDGSDVTTGTPVGYFTLDGGAQATIADTTPVHEGNGQWSFDLTAAEMNGDVVGLVFQHSSAITVHFTIKTDTKVVSELNDFDVATELVDITQAAADKVWGSVTRELTALGFTLAAADFAAAFITASKFGVGAIDALALATDAIAEISDGVWDELLTGHVIADSTGQLLNDWQNAGRLDAILDNILSDTDNIQTRIPAVLVGGAMDADVSGLQANVITAASIEAAALDGKGDWNTVVPLNAAQIESEVNDALVAIHLDHLFAVDYDPAAKPGIATALLNELVESDAGVSRYTANALEQMLSTTMSEISSIPAATPTVAQSLMLTYQAIRNKRDTTAGSDEIHDSAGGVIGTAAISDDATTFTKGKYA